MPFGQRQDFLVSAVASDAPFYPCHSGLLEVSLAADVGEQLLDPPALGGIERQRGGVEALHRLGLLAPQMAAVTLHPHQLPGARGLEAGSRSLMRL